MSVFKIVGGACWKGIKALKDHNVVTYFGIKIALFIRCALD